MDRFVNKIRFWDPKSPAAPTPTSAKTNHLSTRVTCSDETIDYRAYHICAFDPVLSVLLCVGDNVPVVVLGSHRRRVTFPVRKGARWIDCHIFAGTSSFLLLSPEALLLMDYMQRSPSSGLFARGGEKMFFSCLHVPQGLTWGAVGCRSGDVLYWKLTSEEGSAFSKITWAAWTTDVVQFCAPFCTSNTSTTSIAKRVHCIDSYPTNPNALIAVVAGVPGVIKWYMDENRVSCFFALDRDVELTVCRITPGGAYVAATTRDVSAVYLWSDDGKRRKDKSVDLMWVIESRCPSSAVITAKKEKVKKENDEEHHDDDDDDDDDGSDREEGIAVGAIADDWNTGGMHIARASETRAHSDKKRHMVILLYARGETTELVVNVYGKQLLQREDILAHVVAVRSTRTFMQKSKEEEALCRVVPCVRSSYWCAAWTETDFDTLFMTSRDGAPRLIQRSRAKRTVECVTELVDLPGGSQWSEGMLVLAPPVPVIAALLNDPPAEESADKKEPWEAVLQRPEAEKLSGDKISSMDSENALVGVLSGTSASVALLPLSNEIIFISPASVKRHMICSVCGDGITILEEVLPSLPQRSEFILRAVADADSVTVWITYLSLPKVEQLVMLPRIYLLPDENAPDGCVAWSALLVDCRIKQVGTTPTQNQILRGGKSILIQLCDASLILVDLSGGTNNEDGLPLVLRLPAALFPAGSTIASFDTAWITPGRDMKTTQTGNSEESSEACLTLFCVLSSQSGVVVWDICRMRILAYIPQQERCWRWDTVTVTRALPKSGTGEHKDARDEFVVSIGSANMTPPLGCEGRLFLRDVLGRQLFSIRLGYANRVGCDGWNVALGDDASDVEWCSLGHANTKVIEFIVKIVKGTIVVGIVGSVEHIIGEALCIECRVTAADSDEEWPFGLIDSHPSVKQEIVLFRNDAEIGLFRTDKLAWGKPTDRVAIAEYRCDSGRSIECVLLCETLHALLVLTKDTNRWRWLSLLQLDTAEHLMAPVIMVHYSTEEQLSLHIAPEIWGDRLHVYVLGAEAVGHIVLSPIDSGNEVGKCSASPQLQINPIKDGGFLTVPVGFRLYRRCLPVPPTMKQEQGFLKRLMTLPWEEVAIKLEDEVLLKERTESFEEFEKRLTSRKSVTSSNLCNSHEEQALSQRSNPAREKEELLSSGRHYRELKATAVRENISLNEARRIMNENRLRMEERGERISQIENKSRELAEQAATFQELAKRLKEKQRDRWF